MVGCYEDARRILKGEIALLTDHERVSSTEGGDDCSRVVYRLGDVVYKLNDWRDDNTLEYNCLTDLAHHDWAPPVSLYNVEGTPVLCMPYYQHYIPDPDEPAELIGEIELCIEEWHAREGRTRDPDLHEGNYRLIAPGKVVVIDAAGGIDL